MIKELPSESAGASGWQTTGDLDACKFLSDRPGPVVDGCAQTLAQERFGDLELREGPAQYGREPAPGEIEDCGGVVIEEQQAEDALADLRAELAVEK